MSDEALKRPANGRIESVHGLLPAAEELGEEEKLLMLLGESLGRQHHGLRRKKKPLVFNAKARGRQPRGLFQSVGATGKTAQAESTKQKERSTKPNVVFQPFTSKGVPSSTTKSVHRSLAILKLPKIVAQIITFAQNVVTAMTNNPKFPSPIPALSLVTAAIPALADADAENSANIIQSAGFAVKKTVVHKPRTFEVTQGAASGTAKVVCPIAAHRASYDWEYSTDAGKTWIAFPTRSFATSRGKRWRQSRTRRPRNALYGDVRPSASAAAVSRASKARKRGAEPSRAPSSSADAR